ncbi:MAG: hypothetical protein M3Z05_15260 [Gemmatimonadota bacterium]|nr:hypothetical protein [Gemmatimonadota bacterium]
MPGFRLLPENITGLAADRAREGTVLEGTGDLPGAISLYEAALAESLAESPQMPGFLCGRLAAMYRRERRYQDEVDLLEGYRDSQTNEVARSRFDARLSKARALADKHIRSESSALASVRAIKRSVRRPSRAAALRDEQDGPTPLS